MVAFAALAFDRVLLLGGVVVGAPRSQRALSTSQLQPPPYGPVAHSATAHVKHGTGETMAGRAAAALSRATARQSMDVPMAARARPSSRAPAW